MRGWARLFLAIVELAAVAVVVVAAVATGTLLGTLLGAGLAALRLAAK